jgi:hypothetical protein
MTMECKNLKKWNLFKFFFFFFSTKYVYFKPSAIFLPSQLFVIYGQVL